MTNTTNTSGLTEQNAKPHATPSMAELNMRDYFAAKAIQGMCAATPWGANHSTDVGSLSVAAYAIADTMIAERAK